MGAFLIKKDDMVRVITGDDKGVEGKVLKVLPKEKKLIVEGVNMVKKHTKARPPKLPQGGIIEKASPIDISNVVLLCSKCGKPTRPRKEKGQRGSIRFCRQCGEAI